MGALRVDGEFALIAVVALGPFDRVVDARIVGAKKALDLGRRGLLAAVLVRCKRSLRGLKLLFIVILVLAANVAVTAAGPGIDHWPRRRAVPV
jgi:hypothetical protein